MVLLLNIKMVELGNWLYVWNKKFIGFIFSIYIFLYKWGEGSCNDISVFGCECYMRLRIVVYRYDWSVVARVVVIEVKLKINNIFRYKKVYNLIKIKLIILILVVFWKFRKEFN